MRAPTAKLFAMPTGAEDDREKWILLGEACADIEIFEFEYSPPRAPIIQPIEIEIPLPRAAAWRIAKMLRMGVNTIKNLVGKAE